MKFKVKVSRETASAFCRSAAEMWSAEWIELNGSCLARSLRGANFTYLSAHIHHFAVRDSCREQDS